MTYISVLIWIKSSLQAVLGAMIWSAPGIIQTSMTGGAPQRLLVLMITKVGIVKLQVDDELMFSNAAHQAKTENYSIHQKVKKAPEKWWLEVLEDCCFVLNG